MNVTKSNEMFGYDDGYLGYLLRKAAGAYRLKMERVLLELKVTSAQFAILSIIYNCPGLPNAEIARLSLLTPQTVNQIISKLESQNLLIKKKHPTNKKVQQLELTESGVECFHKCNVIIEDLEVEIKDQMPPDIESGVREWLKNIIEN